MNSPFGSIWRRVWTTIRVAPFALADFCLPVLSSDKPQSPLQTPPASTDFTAQRNRMVDLQLAAHGIHDQQVLNAMRAVPRHLLIPPQVIDAAYEDGPLPIGSGQTISQPYVVAFMTEALKLKPTDKVLEIGTGSGYQTAVLAKIVHEVYTIEIVESLAQSAQQSLAKLGYKNVHFKAGDGYRGWPEHAPFDAIIVTAAPDHVPQPLIDQLKPGGHLVLPVGSWSQSIKRITRTTGGTVQEDLLPVQFVPMTGEAKKHR